jgi:hypothetical protein
MVGMRFFRSVADAGAIGNKKTLRNLSQAPIPRVNIKTATVMFPNIGRPFAGIIYRKAAAHLKNCQNNHKTRPSLKELGPLSLTPYITPRKDWLALYASHISLLLGLGLMTRSDRRAATMKV